jgi:hypothetical protein
MFGAHRRGFDWKEIAKVLHVTRAVARATFWREISAQTPSSMRCPSRGTWSKSILWMCVR